MKNKRIVCEIPLKDYECIERLVESGRYRSIVDFVDIAVHKLLGEEAMYDLDYKTLKRIKKALGIN